MCIWTECAAFFTQTHTYRTGCPWVWPHPVCFHLLLILPWDQTEKVNISGHLPSRAENVRDDLLSCFIFSAWYNRRCENMLSVLSEAPAISCMWCANGSQTHSGGSVLHWRSASAHFTFANSAQAKLKTFLHEWENTARDYLQVATFKGPARKF